MSSIVDAVYDAFGTLDCLVNNAGVSAQKRGDLLDLQPDSFDRVVGINLRGTFFLTQAAARRMVAEQRAPDSPARSIITISSINAWLVGPDRGEYCISKAGLTMMTKLFAVRLAPHRIHTYEIRPGMIATDMTAVAREKYDRLIGAGLTPIARWGITRRRGRGGGGAGDRGRPVQHRRRLPRRRRHAYLQGLTAPWRRSCGSGRADCPNG